ncbi:MAG: hypothetical protein J6S67_20985 [Methanobrevibacter sp.]|nr:hypothetical protein [Methanobrevibacter sp.]
MISPDKFTKWNATTATCYHYHMICKNCPNDETCGLNTKTYGQYYMRAVKYATLCTYANIGKEGLKRFLG